MSRLLKGYRAAIVASLVAASLTFAGLRLCSAQSPVPTQPSTNAPAPATVEQPATLPASSPAATPVPAQPAAPADTVTPAPTPPSPPVRQTLSRLEKFTLCPQEPRFCWN